MPVTPDKEESKTTSLQVVLEAADALSGVITLPSPTTSPLDLTRYTVSLDLVAPLHRDFTLTDIFEGVAFVKSAIDLFIIYALTFLIPYGCEK